MQPDEVGLALGRVGWEVVEGGEDAGALLDHELAATLHLGVPDAQGLLHGGLRECVHPEGRGERVEQLSGRGGAHRVAGAQARQPVDLREGAEHDHVVVVVDEPQDGVLFLHVLELHERLVHQQRHVRRQGPGERAHLGGGQVGARGVVRVAEHDCARALAHAREHRGGAHAARAQVHRHGSRARAGRHQRVERVGGPGSDQLGARPQQLEGGGLQQLRRAVADHDLLRRDAVALRKLGPDARRMAVRVAVHSSSGTGDRRVHYLRVGHVGPLGAGQVHARHPLERQRALTGAPLAQAAVPLLLIDVLELAVVVEQAHQGLGAISGPGPAMIRNQKMKPIAAMPALTTKMRSSAPRFCSCPAARRASFQV